MFRITVEGQFSAAHQIRNYPGPCCRLHGHNYGVEVFLEGDELDELGMLIDFGIVKRALADVLQPLDHAYLNDVEPFTTINPTSEALARYIYQRLRETMLTTDDLRRRVRLREVIVYETARQGVGYGE